jgi:hypothetical protein
MLKKIPVFSPLDKLHLAESVVNALLHQPVYPLRLEESFVGAGIYAIYYTGDHAAYAPLAEQNRAEDYCWPIYMGKAIPAGGRKGGFEVRAQGQALAKRLREHATSVEQAENLRLEDFHCRFLIVDELWIPLGENLMIERYQPVWNACLDGFGNHDPGSGRYNGKCPPWDIVHPGRPWAARCQLGLHSEATLLHNIAEHLTRCAVPRPGAER